MHPLAVVHSYDDLHAALRARADALEISRESIDHIAGLPAGYAAKALLPLPSADDLARAAAAGRRLSGRTLGPQTLGPMLETLGLVLVVVEDAEAMARLQRRYTKRNRAQALRATHSPVAAPSA